jgi:hypothetical protein
MSFVTNFADKLFGGWKHRGVKFCVAKNLEGIILDRIFVWNGTKLPYGKIQLQIKY